MTRIWHIHCRTKRNARVLASDDEKHMLCDMRITYIHLQYTYIVYIIM
jgi:hypothetical protein